MGIFLDVAAYYSVDIDVVLYKYSFKRTISMYLFYVFRITGEKIGGKQPTIISDDIDIPLVWNPNKINQDGSTGGYEKAE